MYKIGKQANPRLPFFDEQDSKKRLGYAAVFLSTSYTLVHLTMPMIKHRDSNAALFSAISQYSIEDWNNWQTQQRVEQLEEVLENLAHY
ncbi:hypothetical protein THO17_07180 [Marinomonas sp. THO17]